MKYNDVSIFATGLPSSRTLSVEFRRILVKDRSESAMYIRTSWNGINHPQQGCCQWNSVAFLLRQVGIRFQCTYGPGGMGSTIPNKTAAPSNITWPEWRPSTRPTPPNCSTPRNVPKLQSSSAGAAKPELGRSICSQILDVECSSCAWVFYWVFSF